MTLIVSLRIPDGIVIAGDSLSTMMAQIDLKADLSYTCPQCKYEGKLNGAPAGHLNLPSTTYSYAQKIFSFLGEYGVGTFGAGQLSGKTMYFSIRELEKELRDNGTQINDVMSAARAIGQRALKLVEESVPNLDQAPDEWYCVGFQVVGYDGTNAKTIDVYVGREVKYMVNEGPGCTHSGQGHVVDAIWKLYDERPSDKAAYDAFSLQDAIAYAEFLIGTTSAYQRFSRNIPQVGGEIDIALITPFDHFKWIKQKELSRILGGKNG